MSRPPADTLRMKLAAHAGKKRFGGTIARHWTYLRQSDGTSTLEQTHWQHHDSRAEWREAIETARKCNPQGRIAERWHDHQLDQHTALDADSGDLAYDATGNMTGCRPDKNGDWTKGYTLVWDAWSRADWRAARQTERSEARRVRLPRGGIRVNLTRRTTSTVSGTVRHFYYNDVWKCVEERLNATTNPERVYYWSTLPGHHDELLRRDRATSGGALNETLWCLMDYFDPIAIADGSGTIQERYTYSAFGLVTVLTPTFTPRSTSSSAWNFLFHGQFRDSETGWDNYGYRYYLPWLGRWPNRDPIGEVGGVNLLAITANDSINRLDLTGLSPDDHDNCCINKEKKPCSEFRGDSKICGCIDLQVGVERSNQAPWWDWVTPATTSFEEIESGGNYPVDNRLGDGSNLNIRVTWKDTEECKCVKKCQEENSIRIRIFRNNRSEPDPLQSSGQTHFPLSNNRQRANNFYPSASEAGPIKVVLLSNGTECETWEGTIG